MGINVDDSLRLTKSIQQDTTNSKHKSLAQTIFTAPIMTLSQATSLFETYNPGGDPPSARAPSVNALFSPAQNKIKSQSDEKPRTSSHKKKKWRFTCAICDSTDHSSFKCPKRESSSGEDGRSRLQDIPLSCFFLFDS
jgi:hypothetical protein